MAWREHGLRHGVERVDVPLLPQSLIPALDHSGGRSRQLYFQRTLRCERVVGMFEFSRNIALANVEYLILESRRWFHQLVSENDS